VVCEVRMNPSHTAAMTDAEWEASAAPLPVQTLAPDPSVCTVCGHRKWIAADVCLTCQGALRDAEIRREAKELARMQAEMQTRTLRSGVVVTGKVVGRRRGRKSGPKVVGNGKE
jgi:hypothetical protein